MEDTYSCSDNSDPTSKSGNLARALPLPKRLLMLAINFWPLVHCTSIGFVVGLAWAPLTWRIFAALAALYLAPPLIARLLLRLLPIREGHIAVGTSSFFVWWALFNLQVLFCRISFFEELLRLIPGTYSLWLRLWGARIGRLTYWAAGIQILDRSFVRIGDDVVFGAAVRLNPHVLSRNERGELELILATVTIGDRAMIGGYSLLAAGTEIAPDECTRAMLLSPPFSYWVQGSRRPPRTAAP
jgi:acetyltransferase-like isoleucine patch superfamily enzyme